MAARACSRKAVQQVTQRFYLYRAAGPRFYSAAADAENDVVVVGGGPGGYVAAIKAAQLGFKTTCIEGRGALGGTCLNVGCIPSKALLQSSHMYHDAQHNFAAHGVNVGTVSVDIGAMMKQKEKAVAGLTKGIEGLFKKNKVTYVKGYGKITSPNEVKVDLLDGGSQTVKGKHIIIATGSAVKNLPGITIDEEKVVSSTGAIALKQVPEKLVVIGGGYIGLEMGSVWGRLGSQVTVVEFGDAIVPSMDAEVRKSFQRSLEKQKMKFKLKTKVVKVEDTGNGLTLHLEAAEGGSPSTLEANVVLVAAGRTPFTKGLGLEELGVKLDKFGRVEVDHSFKTNVPGVYAIGDVIPGPMLAHKAEEDGYACVELLAGKAGHVNYDTVPGVVYTHPEVASVGKTEEQVKAANIKYNVGKFPFMANSRARSIDDAEGMVKIIADKETDKILGVHIMGPSAGELIHEAVLAMEYGASSEDIARVCHGHPTLSEAVKEAAMATYDKPIHF
jgi:dihydrolipoamide dehydrogenase